MYAIAIADRQKALRASRRLLMRVARTALASERVASAEISVALVGDSEIHAINRRFLGHDEPTDVISFLLDESKPARGARPRGAPRGTGKSLGGELIISTETAARRAAAFGWRPRDELLLYLVHGLLHLCGYDDQTPTQRRIMRGREREILGQFGLVPRYDGRRRVAKSP